MKSGTVIPSGICHRAAELAAIVMMPTPIVNLFRASYLNGGHRMAMKFIFRAMGGLYPTHADSIKRRRRCNPSTHIRKSTMSLQMNWERYDPTAESGGRGVYMLLWKEFSLAPIYVGQTGRESFGARFLEHCRAFRDCRKTVLREPFLTTARTHMAFANQWESVRKTKLELRRKYVFVPDICDPPIGQGESVAYWQSLEKIVCPLGDSDKLLDVESRVHQDIVAYYKGLVGHEIDWTVFPAPGRPPVSHFLFGGSKYPQNKPEIEYSLGGQSIGPGDFFSALSSST